MADIFDFYVYDDRSIRYELAEPIMLEDKDVTQFRFRIPKVLNNIDMSSWEWWLIFVNAKKVKYTTQLTLDDDEDDPDNFSVATYTVGYGFSGYVGSVSFSIEALNVSGENIVNEWHTRTYNTNVIDTLQGTRAVVPEPGGQAGTGLTQAEKNLILTLFSKAAYAEDDAGTAYDALEAMWTTTTRIITYNLSHVSSSNSTASIENGQSYTTTLTASTNYTLNSVTVTMGGVDITSTAYSSGTVTIPSVTGNIVITATAILAAQSITATYTQSGTVYDTDSLDSLKDDLVVTANYSGGTSETVPSADYTLSGTLTVGTSTITVSYEGLTDTFNVSVSVYVDPPAYELASATTFNGTSDYVDTGYVLTNTDKNFSIAIEFEPNAPANGATLFDSSHNGSGAFQFWLQSNGSGNYRGQIVSTGVTLFNKSGFSTNAKVVFVHTVGESTINAYISLDGGAKQTVTITLNNFGTNANYLSTTQHLILGARYNLTERFFKGTINKFAVYEYVMEESAIDAFLGVS